MNASQNYVKPLQLSGAFEHGVAAQLESGDSDISTVLPNFCQGTMIVKVVILAELLTMAIIALTQARYTGNLLAEFVTVSLFIQWMALASSAALCVLRRWLNSLPPMRAVILAYLVLMAVVIIVSEMAVWVLYMAGHVETIRPSWYGEFHFQNVVVAIFINALILRYLLAIQQLRVRTINDAALQSQVRRYRVRPRFLFNTLNNIAGLMRRQPAVAEAATEELADLVRLMLDEKQELTPLNREVTNAQKFISLEALRLEDRLNVQWDIDEATNHCKTPVQVLQLLLEHAIDIGIEPFTDGGTISVKLWTAENSVHLDVECGTESTDDSPSTGSENPAVSSKTENGKKGSIASQSKRQTANDQSGHEKQLPDGESRRVEQRQNYPKPSWQDTTMLDNIKLRLHDIYGAQGSLTVESNTNRLLIRVKHPAEGGSH